MPIFQLIPHIHMPMHVTSFSYITETQTLKKGWGKFKDTQICRQRFHDRKFCQLNVSSSYQNFNV